MANTYASLHYHIIFSTKNREPWIFPEIEGRVWKFMGGIARKHGMTALQIGGIEDHIHTLITAPPTFAPCQISQLLKGESSKWIHREFHELKRFAWQDGYGSFSSIPALKGRAKVMPTLRVENISASVVVR
jgi:REP element-mobilizing transposase RayT